MKQITALLIIFFCSFNVSAATIKMFGKEENGFNQPKYVQKFISGTEYLDIYCIAKDNHFPFSSKEQETVFYKVFEELTDKEHIAFHYSYPNDFQKKVENFERGKSQEYINAYCNAYYEHLPYSKNEYIYPAFFENKIYVITSIQNKLELTTKESLKKYRGIRSKTDQISSFVAKDFSNLKIKEVDNYAKAYEELLTGKADYLVASYYPSLIEAYKLGIRNYIIYSANSVWKMPMFIRIHPKLKNNSRIKAMEKYLKSSRYKKIRDAAFEELIEIYKNNTLGIVPPTYINTEQKDRKEEKEAEEKTTQEQKLEN
ncbi:MAG: hypothetical protein J6C85_00350 [Alphaproteobacteria bacterium]|nr:hypothetical protein [Alphaproteobacteria bacterium]